MESGLRGVIGAGEGSQNKEGGTTQRDERLAELTGELDNAKHLMEVVQMVKVAHERQKVAKRDLRLLRQYLSSVAKLTSSATPGTSSHPTS